jgi:hypothetical protein
MDISVIPLLILLFALGYLLFRAASASVHYRSIFDPTSRVPAQRATQQRLQAASEWIGNAQNTSAALRGSRRLTRA